MIKVVVSYTAGVLSGILAGWILGYCMVYDKEREEQTMRIGEHSI